jgi:predicted RNA-binding protein (virulence factor B family)
MKEDKSKNVIIIMLTIIIILLLIILTLVLTGKVNVNNKNDKLDNKNDVIENNNTEVNWTDKLLSYIKENGGSIQLNDKSPAEDIYDTFQVSKKTFKKAVGDLYKKRLIVIEANGIRLAKD